MSVNKFIGIGNITRNAEVRTVGQNQVAKFGLAMSEKFRKADGSVGENTEFIDVELWGQQGVHQYLVKGQMIYVEGSLRTDQWQGQDGQTHRATKVRAFSVQLLGNRPQATPQTQNQQVYAARPQYAPSPAPVPAAPAPQPQYQPAPPAPASVYPQYPPQEQVPPPVDQNGDLPF